jgi:hypothetical protein
MARPKGSTNKQRPAPWPMNLPTKERIELLANIMVDTILEDQKEGFPLLKKITAEQKYSQAFHVTIKSRGTR